MSNTRTTRPVKKTAEASLAQAQLEAGDQGVLLPDDERAQDTEDGGLKVALKGKEFTLADDVNFFALMAWAASDEETSLAATFELLKSLVAEDEWAAFSKHAIKEKAGAMDLGKFINAAMEAISGRPTEAPGPS